MTRPGHMLGVEALDLLEHGLVLLLGLHPALTVSSWSHMAGYAASPTSRPRGLSGRSQAIQPASGENEDGTFESADALRELCEPKGVTEDKEVITYRRIGERSSPRWFVVKYLLGYPDVRNYDGSWTEWGNLVRTPIEKA